MWGSNEFGQLGSNSDSTEVRKPFNLNCSAYFQDHKIIQVECGKQFTMALTEKGEVYTWGQNIHGELGLGNRVNTGKPTHVRSIDAKVKQISAGSCHAAALTEGGSVYTWGYGHKGRYEISSKFLTLLVLVMEAKSQSMYLKKSRGFQRSLK